jgi:hypothetical protein
MLTRLRNPILAVIVLFYLTSFLTAPATAGMVGALASNSDAGKIKGEDLSRIQRALETEIVKSGLEAYGLTAEETRERLQGLSDEQIHLMAQASDRVLAGGSDVLFAIGIVGIVLLVILIMKLLGKETIIK